MADRPRSLPALVAALVASAAVLGIAAGVTLAGITISVSAGLKTLADQIEPGATMECTVADDYSGSDEYDVATSRLTCVVLGDPVASISAP